MGGWFFLLLLDPVGTRRDRLRGMDAGDVAGVDVTLTWRLFRIRTNGTSSKEKEIMDAFLFFLKHAFILLVFNQWSLK